MRNPRKSRQPNLSDLDLTEEEVDNILNKEDFLSNTSNDFDPLKKKNNGSIIELEEISRNLLNSDYEPNNIFNSLDNSNQISDKELDHLLSSGFNTDNELTLKISEKIEKSLDPTEKETLDALDEISKICKGSGPNLTNERISQNNTLTSEIQEGSEIRNKIERISSIGNSLIKGNNTSDLKVLTSEIGDFDTGNYLGAIDNVINSQEVLQSKGDLNDFGECIPEAESEEDSDEGDFIDRRSRVEMRKSLSKEEIQEAKEDKKITEKSGIKEKKDDSQKDEEKTDDLEAEGSEKK